MALWRDVLERGGLRHPRHLAFAGNVIGYLAGHLTENYAFAADREVAAAWPEAVRSYLRYGRSAFRRCCCVACAAAVPWGYHDFRKATQAWQPPPGEADGEVDEHGRVLYPPDRPETWP